MPKIYERKMSATAAQTTGRTLDYAAPIYDWLAPLMVFGFEQRCAGLVIKCMDLEKKNRVLDVGCGTGSLTLKIASVLDYEGSVVGVDAAEGMLAVARKKSDDYCNVSFDAALAESLPYSDGSFDRAVSTFFFHHIDYGLKQKALSEMWRVLVPGGIAIVVDVDIPTTWFGKICAWSGYKLFHQEEIRENIEGRLREAFEASPFESWRQVSHHSGYMSMFELVK